MQTQENWALITGASSGIGRALAVEFAGRGFNVFLTGRDSAALDETAEQCHRSGVQTRILPADLSDPAAVDSLVNSIIESELKIDLLVNNAGFGIDGEFVETDINQNLNLINVQLAAMLKITRAFLPQMIRRNCGRILNVASVYSFSPVPGQSVYSACKAFIASFSASLENELRNTGITVTVIYPGITQTNFRDRAGNGSRSEKSGMTAELVAKAATDATLSGKQTAIPGFQNRLFVAVVRHLPTAAAAALIRRINGVRGVNRKPES